MQILVNSTLVKSYIYINGLAVLILKRPLIRPAMFTLYRIVFAPTRNPYWIKCLFTPESGDFGTVSLRERARQRGHDLQSELSRIRIGFCATWRSVTRRSSDQEFSMRTWKAIR